MTIVQVVTQDLLRNDHYLSVTIVQVVTQDFLRNDCVLNAFVFRNIETDSTMVIISLLPKGKLTM